MTDPDSASHGPIYIGGLDRSGKTTMRAFLASHPNIAIPAVGANMETYFYRQYGDLSRSSNFEACLDAMLRYKHVRFLQPDPERIRREFAAGAPTYERLFALFLMHFAEREGKPRWGAQTGLVERYADQLFAAHPGLKVIHMVRDPRDRYEASISKWPAGKGRAGGAAARWRYSTRLAERHCRNYPGDYLVVRFEDLVRDTEQVVRDVCCFVGERFEPGMLLMPGAARHRTFLQGERCGSDGPILSEEYIGGYRRGVSEVEVAFLQSALSPMMRRHGYAPDPLSRPLRFWLLDLPNQTARMAAWRAVEEAQQRFPAHVRRRPGARMIVDPASATS